MWLDVNEDKALEGLRTKEVGENPASVICPRKHDPYTTSPSPSRVPPLPPNSRYKNATHSSQARIIIRLVDGTSIKLALGCNIRKGRARFDSRALGPQCCLGEGPTLDATSLGSSQCFAQRARDKYMWCIQHSGLREDCKQGTRMGIEKVLMCT